MRSFATLSVLGLIGVVRAHFTLDYPYTRGFDEDKEPNVPCGGFSVNTTRTPFPLSGGYVTFSSFHDTASSVLGVSFDSNPSSLTNFNTTSSGQNYPLLVPTFSTTVEGSFCIQVNISSLGVSEAKNGANATILMVYDGGDGVLHQCSDVTLTANYTVPSSVSCKDAGTVSGGSTSAAPQSSTSTGTASGTSTSSAAPSSTSGAASALSVSRGGIGALLLALGSVLAL